MKIKFLLKTAKFWNTHDMTDYREVFETVAVDAELKHRRFQVEVDDSLLETPQAAATERGVSVNDLVSKMLREKIRSAA